MREFEELGIVGGGQLGRMLTEAALPMGFDVAVLDPTDNSPAKQAGAFQIEGSLTDANAIRELAILSGANVITWEIEHIDADTLIELQEKQGVDVQPFPRSLKLINDKLRQKQYLGIRHGLPVADFMPVDTDREFEIAKRNLEHVIIKTRKNGFDGRGNLVVEDQTWKEVVSAFGDRYSGENALYAEQVIPFQKELAVLVARDRNGKTAIYPVVETEHSDNICNITLAPANIDPKIAEAARDLGHTVVQTFDGAGIFAVEMFVDGNDNLLVNEVAPRVHNSGHWTIEGSQTSQFEQHVRAVMGLPLGSVDMRAPAAAMINILGERNGPVELKGRAEVLRDPNVKLHLYGKSPTMVARKMGHITVLADNVEDARARAVQARQEISI